MPGTDYMIANERQARAIKDAYKHLSLPTPENIAAIDELNGTFSIRNRCAAKCPHPLVQGRKYLFILRPELAQCERCEKSNGILGCCNYSFIVAKSSNELSHPFYYNPGNGHWNAAVHGNHNFNSVHGLAESIIRVPVYVYCFQRHSCGSYLYGKNDNYKADFNSNCLNSFIDVFQLVQKYVGEMEKTWTVLPREQRTHVHLACNSQDNISRCITMVKLIPHDHHRRNFYYIEERNDSATSR